MVSITIARTKKGHAAMWESGGGWTKTGEATLVAGPNGERKRAIFIRGKGPLACAEHALIPIAQGDLVIRVRRWRSELEVKVYRLREIGQEEAKAELAYEFRGNRDGSGGLVGEWVPSEPGEPLGEAVAAGVRKAFTYHARYPVWIA